MRRIIPMTQRSADDTPTVPGRREGFSRRADAERATPAGCVAR
jgi:hypothetical protein